MKGRLSWPQASSWSTSRGSASRCRRITKSCSTYARASFARSGAGDHWLAIGDARIAPDPLSGQGIIWAIDDAVAVMELLTRMEWRDLIQHMRARTANEVNAYCLERSRVYLSEQRFKNDAYWSAIPDHLRLNEIGPLAPEN
jgi:2-polyprenyl-6-methoxyphenol hydroxylase-like FAD-dependent oxidoreductase